LNKIKNTKINQTLVKYSSSLGNENTTTNKKCNQQKKGGKSCVNKISSKIENRTKKNLKTNLIDKAFTESKSCSKKARKNK